MCRTAGRRCKNCNDPQRRRDRQNLAYAVSKEQKSVAETPATATVAPPEPTTLAEAVAGEVKTRGLEEFSETEIAEKISEMLASPKVAQEISREVREDRENAESNKAWLLNGKEDTPENLAAGIAERQVQIEMVGAVIAERAAAIHGVDIDAEREKWGTRVQEAKDLYDEKRKITDEKTADWHSYRRRLTEEKDISIYSLSQHLTDDEKAQLKVLEDAKKAANRESMDAHLKVQEIIAGKDAETIALMDKIAEGNRKAIAEVRAVGNEPVQFRNTIRGGQGEVNSFNSIVAETFPDDWVKKSNELGNLALKRAPKNNGRAHYISVRENAPEYRSFMRSKPDPGDDRFEGWTEKLDENGNPTGHWHGLKRDFVELRNHRNYKKYDGDVPKGTGWKRGNAMGNRGNLIPGWVRDNATDLKYQKSLSAPEAEITMYVGQGPQETRRVVTHEFSHRVEDANRHIPMLEEGFLASRTTLENGKREPLKVYKKGALVGTVAFNSGKYEVTREDNFVDPYMGKEYTDYSREVLSMGSEAVFSGSRGGLVGIGASKSDPQMRNWILGVYATM